MIKFIFPFLVTTTVISTGCGPAEAEKAEQQRLQDSISLAGIDSINKERIIEEYKQYLNVDSAKNVIQIEYDAVLVHLDSLTEDNYELEEKLMKKTSEVSELKAEIGKILTKPTLTPEESTKVRLLIGKLGEKVDRLGRRKKR